MKKPIPFGKYYLLERINVGGMAEVFKAKAFGVEGFERLLAVKRILPNIAEDEEFITMFIDEAKIAVQLNHANIAQIFDLGKVDDSYFIALEHIHGKDLRAIFDRCRATGENMPIAQACFITMKVCEGLDYAHNKRDASGRGLELVHRDISPQNVLISYEGEVKLIDFGIAKAAGKASKTQAGILKGKFGYMSPEQVRGIPLDRRSDIFSVGIVLYELLTGERLFIGESDFSTLEKVRNVEILPPSTYNRKIPDELERIVLKSLAKDVEDRYQEGITLHEELQAFMYTAGEFYSRKDLAKWMKSTFARELAEETRKLDEYRDLRPPSVGASMPAPSYDMGYSAAANVSAPSYDDADLDWDDEEVETQLYDSRGQEGFGGETNPNQPLPAAAANPYPESFQAAPEIDPFEAAAIAPPPPAPEPMPPVEQFVHAPPAPAPAMQPIAPTAAPPISATQPVMASAGPAPVARSGGGGKLAMITVVILLLVGGAAAAIYFLVIKKDGKGTLKIRLPKHPDAIITVDDGPKEYNPPLTLALSAGPHRITIRKKGFETKVRNVEIRAGQTTELELPLKPALGVVSGGIEVRSVPNDAEVILDGKPLTGKKTNLRVLELKLGFHEVRVQKPGYHPWPHNGPHRFEVKPGEVSKIIANLVLKRVMLGIRSSAKKAKFKLYKGSDVVQSGSVPKSVLLAKIDPQASYRIEVSTKGHPKWSKTLAFAGATETEITVFAPFSSSKSMERSSPAPSVMHSYTPPVMTVTARVAPMPPPVTRPRPAGGGFGILRIASKPWTKVYVDGVYKGTTPLPKLRVTAGKHRVVLMRNKFSIRKTYWVNVPAKQTRTLIKRFKTE